MTRHILMIIAALTLGACSTPQAPNPIAAPTKVNLKPVKDRVVVIDRTNKSIGTQLDTAIVAAHTARLEAEAATMDKAKVLASLTVTEDALAKAKASQQEQEDYIMTLRMEAQKASDEADDSFSKATVAVERANTAEGKVYKFELQEKADSGNWGLNGIWRWTRHLGWRVIILVVIIGLVTLALRLLVPAAIPVFTAIWSTVLWAFRAFFAFIKRLLTKRQ